MIPSKILVYHRPEGNTSRDIYKSSRHYRKSQWDLFQKGYQVKSGSAPPEKEEPLSFWQSLVPYCRACVSWGKFPSYPVLVPVERHMFFMAAHYMFPISRLDSDADQWPGRLLH